MGCFFAVRVFLWSRRFFCRVRGFFVDPLAVLLLEESHLTITHFIALCDRGMRYLPP